jgi:hypothetical protein
LTQVPDIDQLLHPNVFSIINLVEIQLSKKFSSLYIRLENLFRSQISMRLLHHIMPVHGHNECSM